MDTAKMFDTALFYACTSMSNLENFTTYSSILPE